MINKDYFLRLTAEIARVIAAVAGKNVDEALEYFNGEYDTWLNMNRAELDDIPVEDFVKTLVEEKGIAVNRLELLAEMLVEEGKLLYEAGRLVESRVQFQKSLLLFDYVDQEQQTFDLGRMDKLRIIRELLSTEST
ncbi:MAG: hypothetical protein AB8G22_05590 [Saprospiraceae bacterium]